MKHRSAIAKSITLDGYIVKIFTMLTVSDDEDRHINYATDFRTHVVTCLRYLCMPCGFSFLDAVVE